MPFATFISKKTSPPGPRSWVMRLVAVRFFASDCFGCQAIIGLRIAQAWSGCCSLALEAVDYANSSDPSGCDDFQANWHVGAPVLGRLGLPSKRHGLVQSGSKKPFVVSFSGEKTTNEATRAIRFSSTVCADWYTCQGLIDNLGINFHWADCGKECWSAACSAWNQDKKIDGDDGFDAELPRHRFMFSITKYPSGLGNKAMVWQRTVDQRDRKFVFVKRLPFDFA